jgi:hypothetical protein
VVFCHSFLSASKCSSVIVLRSSIGDPLKLAIVKIVFLIRGNSLPHRVLVLSSGKMRLSENSVSHLLYLTNVRYHMALRLHAEALPLYTYMSIATKSVYQ